MPDDSMRFPDLPRSMVLMPQMQCKLAHQGGRQSAHGRHRHIIISLAARTQRLRVMWQVRQVCQVAPDGHQRRQAARCRSRR